MLVCVPALLGVGTQTEFTPASVSGLRLWLKADSLSLNDGDLISTWNDSSGNGFSATASGTARPTFKTNIQNGLPVVRFNGTTQVLQASTNTIITSQPNMFFIVANQTTKSGSRLVDGLTDGGRQNIIPGGDGTPTIWAGTFLNGSGDQSGAFHVWTCKFNGASSAIYIDGTLNVSGDAGTNAGCTYQFGGDGGGSPFNGDIAEILIYNVILSSGDQSSIEGFLRSKYNF